MGVQQSIERFSAINTGTNSSMRKRSGSTCVSCTVPTVAPTPSNYARMHHAIIPPKCSLGDGTDRAREEAVAVML